MKHLNEIISNLRQSKGLDIEEVHNLILDLEVVEKVKYSDALREIKSFPARDIAETWSAEKWAEFYKQDIEKLQRIAASALYEVKI